jgi:hypothetical protein
MSEAGDRLKAGVIEALAFANGDEPAASITINGHRYVSEATLASWGSIEVMTRNPAVSERISDLEARLQVNYYGEVLALRARLKKAEAERAQWAGMVGEIVSTIPLPETLRASGTGKDLIEYISRAIDQRNTARNDALEEAAMACLARGKVNVSSYGQYSNAAMAIRALKTP